MSFLDNVSSQVAAADQAANGGNNFGGGNPNLDATNALIAALSGAKPEDKPAELTPEEELQQLLTPSDKDHKDNVFDPNALFGNIKPEDMQAEFGKLNFVNDLFTEEVVTAIAGGGQDAVKAMAQVMNAMGQKIAKNSFTTGTRMITYGLTQAAPAWQQASATTLRDTNIAETIKEVDPLFNNPLTADIVSKIQQGIVAKNPNATKQEVKDYATKALAVLRGGAPTTQEIKPKNEPEQTDWTKFIFG